MERMCQLSSKEKLNDISIMLSGDALVYYSSNAQGCLTHDEAIIALQNWYDNSDIQAIILKKRQSLWFTEETSKNPNASEVKVFWRFVDTRMSLQEQLDPSYHYETFLRDRLMTAVEIPTM